MAWITKHQVEPVLRTELLTDQWIDGLIDHAQGLAEVEIGTQEEPSAGIQAILAQVVARMWQDGESARVNPAGFAQETTGPFGFQDTSPGTAGLGLTNREKGALRRAAGLRVIGTLPTTRGDLETAAVVGDPAWWPEDEPWT
jgi:hypothetical protein